MEGCHGALSPMDPNVRLSNENCEDKRVTDHKQYLSIVGSLMYAALGTRPDLSYCVTALSRYNATPLKMHLTAAKRALRYLKQIADHRLFYPRAPKLVNRLSSEAIMHGFTDSDWAGNELTRKSVGGCIFYAHVSPEMEHWGGPGCDPAPGAVHWQSKTQTVVALSTLEAEYIACSDAVREAIWVRRLLADIVGAVFPGAMGAASPAAVRIGCDNQGALKLIETGVSKQKTKHIDIKYHHVRDEEAKGTIHCYYIHTTCNPADLLTKALPAPRHRTLVGLTGLQA